MGPVTKKESFILEIQNARDRAEENLKNVNAKLIGKVPLGGAKHFLWEEMEIEITKFREYLILVQDEYFMAMSCNHKCKNVFDELTNMPKLT